MVIVSRSLFIIGILLGSIGLIQAESLYVTDRILLGVHTEPNEESPLLDSVSSGALVEVMDETDAFKQVKLPNGKVGWVSSGYLVKEKPATAQVDQYALQTQQMEKLLKETKEKLSKKEREIQVRMDELSNARTSIRDMKKKLKNKAGKQQITVDPKMAEELASANQEIENLKSQLEEKKKTEPVVPVMTDEKNAAIELKKYQEEASLLKARIEMALANLKGEVELNESELERLNPKAPAWVCALMVVVLVIGIVGGISWMDYKHRQRHGGFRV